MSQPFRLGILSTARIAHGFVDGLKGSDALRVDAVGSRTQDAADAFAARHGIPRAHASYEALLADSELDGVYIALPNSLHAPWAERALRAGLHVLCEKPLTVTPDEAAVLFATARDCGRVLLEAYPYRYQPQTLLLRQLIDDGAVGEVRLVQSSFGFTTPPATDIRLDPVLGGGALFDAGCYAVSVARLAVGARPLKASAQARWHAHDVDIALAGTVHYEGGAMAQIGCSMDGVPHRRVVVVGTAGLIESDYLNHTTDARPGTLRLRRGTGWDEPVAQPYPLGNGFRFETERFVRMVREPQAGDDLDRRLSLDNAATIEAMLRSAREGRIVDVRALD